MSREILRTNGGRCATECHSEGGSPRNDRSTPKGLSRGVSAQALLDSPGGDLGSRAEAKLRQDAADVAFDRRLADNERHSDLAIRTTIRDERGHLALPRGKPAESLLCG